jgi:hypothetical protein
MREAQRDQFIAFRADCRLAGALHERASLAGVSVSQFLRSVVSDRVTTSERNEHATADA